jgi:hypothetical protein
VQSEANAVPDPAQSEANSVPDPAQSEANSVPDPAQSEPKPGRAEPSDLMSGGLGVESRVRAGFRTKRGLRIGAIVGRPGPRSGQGAASEQSGPCGSSRL